MYRKFTLSAWLLLFAVCTAFGQSDSTAKLFGIKFTGFVRNDAIYDSRQMVGLREGDLSLYPKDTLPDSKGDDVNAAPTFHMLAITSRLSGVITGPDAFGAKTSGILEAEFFGNFDGGINEFRLRHAWAKLDWAKTQLAFGQFWHPMFVTDCYPGVINFNTGMPFQPFNRSPQIRLTQKAGANISIIVAAIAQRDFASTAPSGYAATDPARNAGMPNMHLQLQYRKSNVLLGAGVDYLSLRPRLTSGAPAVISTEKANSVSFIAYGKVALKPVTIKAEVVVGENLTHFIMIGGYLGYVNDTVTKVESFKPTKTTSMWVDICGNGKKVVPGIFFGYTKNDGADKGAKYAYTRNVNVTGRTLDHVMRVSPRVEFLSGKVKFALECEYTSAEYGKAKDNGTVDGDRKTVNNVRGLFTSTLSF